MIVTFGNQGTEDVFNGRNTREANRTCPRTLWKVAGRKLDQLDTVARLQELAVPPGNRLEVLRGDRQGEYSIRINEKYRVTFLWTDAGPANVAIVDYH